MIRFKYLVLSLLLISLSASISHAQSKSDSANLDAIRDAVRAQQDATPYEHAQLEMKIVNEKGKERIRSMEVWTHSSANSFKSLVKFDKPATVRGTGLLTIRKESDQVQKLYLPALKKVQTIGSSQKGDSFMSSDFTFEDLGQFETKDATWSLISETDENWMIHATQNESSFDSLQITISKKMSQPTLVLYFKKGSKVKQLEFLNWVEEKKEVWRSSELKMTNFETKGYTELSWKNRTFDEISDSYFTERMLSRRN